MVGINKKRLKVKKKSVKSKKVVKKKSSVKQTRARKKNKKRQLKKKFKKQIIKKRTSMEDIYAIINRVQTVKRIITFQTNIIDAATIENTIRDTNLRYRRQDLKTKIVFTVYPTRDELSSEDSDFNIEVIDDEIPDADQIFG